MKILLLSLHWVEYLIEMANALAARGHRCEVIMKAQRVLETVGDELPQLLDPDVRWHLLDDRPRGFRDPRQIMTCLRLVRLIRSIDPDVISLHEATTTYVPLCLALAGRRPLVLTIHDVSTHLGNDSLQPRRRDRVRRYLRGRADAVILHGEWLMNRYLAEHGDRCRNVHAIPHGCYTVLKHWARQAVVEIPQSALFFGRLHAYKGIDVLLRACDLVRAQIPDFRLIVAGDGDTIETHYKRLIEDPGCLVRRGYLSNAQVAEVFQQASIVVLPYLEGSQSGVVRIAYVFGKPVVVTAVGSIPESVRDGVTGLVVPPGDERALATAMVALLKNDARRLAMGKAAAGMAETDLAWTEVAHRTERSFEEVLLGRSAGVVSQRPTTATRSSNEGAAP